MPLWSILHRCRTPLFGNQHVCTWAHITFYILMLWYLLVVTLDLLTRKHIFLPERAFVRIVDQQL
jgi:hypothetical protein